MTQAEIRGTTTAYFHIRELLSQPLTDDTKTRFQEFLSWVESECQAVTSRSAPARWARSIVGPVLAAALGAATYMREIKTRAGALRIFGLSDEIVGVRAYHFPGGLT